MKQIGGKEGRLATIDPDALAALAREVPDGRPIVLINLLRYRQQTSVEGEELSGRQAYECYAKALEPIIMAVGGRLIWRGQARFALIGPPDERWDEVILVAYPRRSAFEGMLRAPEYQASAVLRTAALEDSRLIVATAATPVPSQQRAEDPPRN
jgi:uncharacterized protein (DUF1330 family)